VALRRRRASPVLVPVPAAPPAQERWHTEPGFSAVALDEPPVDEPGLWTAAAEAIDVTDQTVELPALAPLPDRRAARAGRALLTLVLVLGCGGGAVAASGVLKTKHEASPEPVVTGSSSTVAASRHHARPVHHKRVVRRHHRRRHVRVAARRIVAAAPVRTTRIAPVRAAPVHHVVSKPTPRPAPEPAASQPTTAPQPAASAPSGEPGRQPPAPQP
jgi:hypothetical protein